MQLTLIRMPRSGQTDMLVQTRFGARVFEMGKAQSVPDDEALEIAGGQYGACFAKGDAKPTAEGKAVVRGAQLTTRAPSAEEAASEEATKMVSSKDYKIK